MYLWRSNPTAHQGDHGSQRAGAQGELLLKGLVRRVRSRSTNAVSLRGANIQLAMNRSDLLSFMREPRLGIQSSVSPTGEVQAAVVGIAVSERFEVIFDTIETSRRVHNLRRNPNIALVIGGTSLGDERTVQYVGRGQSAASARHAQIEQGPRRAPRAATFAMRTPHRFMRACRSAGVVLSIGRRGSGTGLRRCSRRW